MVQQSYIERRPAPELAGRLSCVWVQEVPRGAEPYAHRTVPNGGVEIACRIGEMPQLIGPQTGPVTEILAPGTIVVGVRFRPGAAPSVLNIPATELVDLEIGADELWGDHAIALAERIAAAPSPQEAAATLEREILARAIEGEDPDPIATEAVRHLLPWHASEVTSLTDELFISERQLRRRCLAAIGLAPKALHRMLRFQGFLALAGQREHPSAELALLAAEAGYADQSHLTRESIRLAGLTPRALLLESERDCGPAHDHGASYGPLLLGRAAGASRWEAAG
jgi:AraC-like DNA-binding protein